MNLVVEVNPYKPPEGKTETPDAASVFDRRLRFLLSPPLIPFAVHMIVRFFIPSNETLYLALFTLGAVIPALAWSMSMIDRLRLSFWKSYLLASCVWFSILASAFLSPALVDWILD